MAVWNSEINCNPIKVFRNVTLFTIFVFLGFWGWRHCADETNCHRISPTFVCFRISNLSFVSVSSGGSPIFRVLRVPEGVLGVFCSGFGFKPGVSGVFCPRDGPPRKSLDIPNASYHTQFAFAVLMFQWWLVGVYIVQWKICEKSRRLFPSKPKEFNFREDERPVRGAIDPGTGRSLLKFAS